MLYITKIIPFLVKLLAGIGIGEILDKFLPEEQKKTIAPIVGSDGNRISPFSGNIAKILRFVVLIALGTVILRFIARKLKIKMLY